MVTLKSRLKRLEKIHGSASEACKQLGIDPAYWSRLKNGEKKTPSSQTLHKLGLSKRTIYSLKKPLQT